MAAGNAPEGDEGGQATVNIVVVRGVEGPSIYLDDHRIAGNKPWGGGQIIHEWNADRGEVLRALGIHQPPAASARPRDCGACNAYERGTRAFPCPQHAAGEAEGS